MNSKKDPLIYFPFYCHQYLSRLRQFSFEEQGMLITMLCIYLINNKNISDEDLLCQSQITKSLKELHYLIEKVREWGNEIELKKEIPPFTILYIIKLLSLDEQFVKIGISCNPKIRFQHFKKEGYQVEIIEILQFDNRTDALLKEAELHKLFYPFRYIPLKDFGGKYECFSIKILEQYDK